VNPRNDLIIQKVLYESAAGQSIPSATSTRIDFGTKVYDIGGASATNLVTTGASWVYTADRTGWHNIETFVMFTSATFTASNSVQLNLMINGASDRQLDFDDMQATTSNDNLGRRGAAEVYIHRGDTLAVNVRHAEGTARSLEADADFVWVAISFEGD
jgi:hypothetical protein